MKKKFATLVILAAVITSTVFAKDIKSSIDPDIYYSFAQKFSNAKEVSWKTTGKYIKASFTLDNQVTFAYFSQSGELLGVSRNITFFELPINLQTELRRNYRDGWITDLFELASDEQTVYFATMESAAQIISLKNEGSIAWSVSKKIKKD